MQSTPASAALLAPWGKRPSVGANLPPLEAITKPTLTTEEAAHYLNRRPQTLRCWASEEPQGVPRPLRVGGRLAWRVADIRALLGVA